MNKNSKPPLKSPYPGPILKREEKEIVSDGCILLMILYGMLIVAAGCGVVYYAVIAWANSL